MDWGAYTYGNTAATYAYDNDFGVVEGRGKDTGDLVSSLKESVTMAADDLYDVISESSKSCLDFRNDSQSPVKEALQKLEGGAKECVRLHIGNRDLAMSIASITGKALKEGQLPDPDELFDIIDEFEKAPAPQKSYMSWDDMIKGAESSLKEEHKAKDLERQKDFER